MWVYLFRHGPAGQRDAERWPDDHRRALTERGMRRTERAARGLSRLERRRLHVLTSPLERATQTAAILERELSLAGPVLIADELAPGGSFTKLIGRIQRLATDAVVIVGHEPDLGRLAGLLVFGDRERALPLRKAGCGAIEFEDELRPGEGRLVWWLTPRMLRRGARKAIRA